MQKQHAGVNTPTGSVSSHGTRLPLTVEPSVKDVTHSLLPLRAAVCSCTLLSAHLAEEGHNTTLRRNSRRSLACLLFSSLL